MARRSLKASLEGIRKAKQAFNRKGWTQEYLAGEVGIETRQPIWKFFSGKPVDRGVFNEICFVLEIDPEEVAQKTEILTDDELVTETEEEFSNQHASGNSLVTKIRTKQYEKIQNQCATVRLLDIAYNVSLNDLYVDVYIVEKIGSQRWVEISSFQNQDSEQGYFQSINKVKEEPRISGIQAIDKYSKLVIFGKPGSGKTTFLQSIAVHCNQSNDEDERIPIFISLKDFSEELQGQNNLLQYIYQQVKSSGISFEEIEQVLIEGKVKVLLDGLDEVLEKYADAIANEINKFSERYYKNSIILSCRSASKHYSFKGFTEVEIADFNQSQIKNFAHKWFVKVAQNNSIKGQFLASQFLEKLEMPENRLIQELVTTPLLLNLTCLVFQYLEDFPTRRSELYRQGLELLLVRWDEARGIKRDDVYRHLSLSDKIKLLSHVADIFFEQGDYFFEEDKICRIIANHLRQTSNAVYDLDALEIQSKAILKSIELQHGLLVEQARGVYSFSHLTFHEYFTARKIVASGSRKSLEHIVSKLIEKRWREVILLTSSMLQPGDELCQLIKQELDQKFADEEKLQSFLRWVTQKAQTVTDSYYPTAIRAFYFTLALPTSHSLSRNQALAIFLDRKLGGKLSNDLSLDLALIHALAVTTALSPEIFCRRIPAIRLALDLEHLLLDNQNLLESLKKLKNDLPHLNENSNTLRLWWQSNSESWIRQLRGLMVNHRQIGHDWQFSSDDWEAIQNYWYANNLLIDCLRASYDMTSDLQSSIEASLFMASV